MEGARSDGILDVPCIAVVSDRVKITIYLSFTCVRCAVVCLEACVFLGLPCFVPVFFLFAGLRFHPTIRHDLWLFLLVDMKVPRCLS